MIDFLKALVVLLSLAAVGVPYFLLKIPNTKEKERCKQFRYPCIALLFSVAVCILFGEIGKLMDWIRGFGFVQDFLNWIAPDGKLEYVVLVYTAIVVNGLLFLAFFFIKGLFRLGVRRKKIPDDPEEAEGVNKLYWIVVSLFYQIRNGKGFPKRNWVKVQRTLKYASWILSALLIMQLILIQLPVFLSYSWVPYGFLETCLKTLYLWPAVSLIIINEFRWFLEGREELAEQGSTVFDHSEIEMFADYGKLVQLYKKQFPERFCAAFEGPGSSEPQNFLNEAVTKTNLEKAISEQLRTRGYTVNDSYLACIRNLSEGKNALVDASVFSYFGEYLFLYLNTVLARGENILFLCADEESAEIYKEYIDEKFKTLNIFHRVWMVKDRSSAHDYEDADILILTPQIILDKAAFTGQRMFFQRLTTVVMADTSEIVAREGEVLTLLAHRLSNVFGKNGGRALRYICLSESVPPETSNALMQLLNLQEKFEYCSGYQSNNKTHLMLWNFESCDEESRTGTERSGKAIATLAQDNLFGKSTSQTMWGVSFPLACVGIKYNVEKISVIAYSGTPYKQILDSMTAQFSRLSGYFDNEVEPTALKEVILANRVNCDDTDSTFMIVEDDLFNLPLAIHNYCRFSGSKTTLIHIVSKPYMLRDYFAAHAKDYVSNEPKISMVMPALEDDRQLLISKLTSEIMENGVEENDFLARMQKIEPAVQDMDAALEACGKLILEKRFISADNLFSFESRSVFDPVEVRYDYKKFIRLRAGAALSSLLKNAKPGRMELRQEKMNLGIPAVHLRQYFVPSQSFAYKGELYTVQSVDAENGVLRVREASERLNSSVDYVQSRIYAVDGLQGISEQVPVTFGSGEGRACSGFELTVYDHVRMTVDTPGFFALHYATAKMDLMNGPAMTPLTAENREKAKREYTNANVVSFKIKDVDPDRSDKAAFLLSVMMNEMMKTLFPYTYPCIAVCPVLSDEESISNDPMGEKILQAYPRLFGGDGFNHQRNCIEVVVIEDSAYELGMIKTLLRDKQCPFSVFLETAGEYLKWMEEYKGTGNISNEYLYFGGDGMPDCFDAEMLRTVCEEFETVRRRDSVKVERLTSNGQCSYCRRELFGVQYRIIQDHAGRNNRKICSKCSKLIVKDESELKTIYKGVRSYLCDSFDIDLPDDITVRFSTAERIRKKLGTGNQRVALGFMNRKTRELWVEADAPRPNVEDVLVHELTHIWQMDNIRMYDQKYVEGHASFVEVQYLRHERRDTFAAWLDESLRYQLDEYGRGYVRISRELARRGEDNSFAYMLELFGPGGTGRPADDPTDDDGSPTDGGEDDGGDGSPTDGGEDDGGDGSPTDGGEDDGGDGSPADDGEGKDDFPEDGYEEGNSSGGTISRTPAACPRYAYNLLSDKEKAAYDAIKESILTFAPEVDLSPFGLLVSEVDKIEQCVTADSPEIFWYGNYKFKFDSSTNIARSFTFTYRMTQATAIRRQKEIDASLKPFFASLKDNMSDYEVVKTVYDNVIRLVDYDSIAILEKEKLSPPVDRPDDLRSIYGVFVKKKAVCAGYAVAFQYLLNRLGIECEYICGDTTEGYHAWNLLKLEGDYYFMDVTWGDRSNTDARKNSDGIGYRYFCLTSEEMAYDHTPDEYPPVPECTATKCNYFRRSGLYFSKYSSFILDKVVADHLGKGNMCVSMKFSNDAAFADACRNTVEGGVDFHDALRAAGRGDRRFSYITDKDRRVIEFYIKR